MIYFIILSTVAFDMELISYRLKLYNLIIVNSSVKNNTPSILRGQVGKINFMHDVRRV